MIILSPGILVSRFVKTGALCASFVIAVLASTSSLASDLLIENIKGYTYTDLAPVGAAPSQFNKILIRDNKVLSTKNAVIERLMKPDTTRIDGQGKILLPGLIDAHGHLTGLGELLSSVDLRDSKNETLAVQQVQSYIDNTKPKKNTWVLGQGWNQANWPSKQFPTSASLDAIKSENPIALARVDGHAVWLNAAALALTGINDATPNPEGGQIIRDGDGKATGVLIDNAMSLVYSKMPQITAQQLDQQLQRSFDHLLSLGVTGVHDAGINQPVIDVLKQRAAKQNLPIRVYGMLDGSDAKLSQWLKAGAYHDEAGFFTIAAVKLYADGALGSRGAALLEAYSDQANNKGLDITAPEPLLEKFKLIDDHQFQICVHAIGDRGNQQVLDAFDALFSTGGNSSLRHRIEHAQVIAPEDLARLEQLDLIASMQPTHATSDMHMAEDRLGKARLTGAYAWRTLLNKGTRMAFGSDFPVESANPFFGIHAAVTRQDHNNQPVPGWRIEEAVSVNEAISLFTRDAAWAAHMETTQGTLEPGKWADFILVEDNPYKVKPEQLWKIKVLETWVAGEKRWPK
ncbi:amidohydrolase [Simiduia curdlanivorans]|uniref:Amidohydrolase n=1 Tax=Simiduia curdlanivorans TaxID=1492769 RepID=A0ABV8V1E8_9GAMM|nr:amidohydrolase [Simiduia curdlanivorans]MDN3640465.1 amidohydrolase [Simiduia curdlanivorans]